MAEQKFYGWICRTWTQTALDGWTSGFERFGTEEEAHEFGRLHNSYIRLDEQAREYEVYKDFTDQF